MKIIHYSTSLSRSAGGLFFSVSGPAKVMLERGLDVHVVGGADEHFEQDQHEWGDVPLHTYPIASGSYAFDRRAIGLIRELKPDVLHVHGIWSAASIYGRAATAMGIPTIVSPHGMLDPWILARRPLVKGIHAALFERPMLRRAHVHALNESERAAVEAFMPDAAKRTFVLPNGVPDARETNTYGPRSGALYLGRLHSKKQTLELIAKWNEIGSPDGERLTVAGWGDADYEAAVRAATEASTAVDFVGPLHGEAKAEAFGRAKWFILPSLSEGLPMAVLEALQHGCIPIITDECNLPELFEDDIALRMENDFSDFAAVMHGARALPDDEAARRSGASSVYSWRYSWDVVADAMKAHYDRIAGGSHRIG